MRGIFKVAVMVVSLLIVTQPVFAETEKSEVTTIPKKEPAMETHKHQVAKPAAAAPAKTEGRNEEAMPPAKAREKIEKVDHYSVCQSKPWLCND